MITENCLFKGVVEKNDSRTIHWVDHGVNWVGHFHRPPIFGDFKTRMFNSIFEDFK